MVLKGFFGGKKVATEGNTNELVGKLAGFFPDGDRDDRAAMACIAGLMARVAYCDLDVHGDEIAHMKEHLGKWIELPQQDIDAIVTVALEHTEELAGVESYQYTDFLSSRFDAKSRFGLLKALFALAAADGTVAVRESEEIRTLSKGLLLESKHFLAARATVLEFLASLRQEGGV